jgi:hypothetical protein
MKRYIYDSILESHEAREMAENNKRVFGIEQPEAEADNDVYGFIVEDCIKSKIHKEYTNVDKDDEDYEEEEWEESDSCWGFYGDIDKMIPFMLENAGLKQEDFEEENV